MDLWPSSILFVLVTAASTYLMATAYKNIKFQLKHKIASRREEAVTREVNRQLGDDKKVTRKENSEVRELTPPTIANLIVDGSSSNDMMTASMIARKITTEEEAKAALAERRRLAREEAERQAELERQRAEAERLAELKAQEEEAERQRLFEEESTRLAEEQRRGEEERLRKAIEARNPILILILHQLID